jgi:hypothetical protein
MRGGAQSQLMRAADGFLYVVKFQNNPQGARVLANELLATRLAEAAGLPVPIGEVIEVSDWLIANTRELHIQLAGQNIACAPGLQFASRYALPPWEGQVLDWLPQSMLDRVRNLETFAGMLAFDKWLCNADSRQAVWWRRSRERRYTASFIDHGYCFNAAEWSFPDSPLRGAYPWNDVYVGVRGWESFEPWLSRLEQISDSAIFRAADVVPPEWYNSDADAMEKLLATLVRRRSRLRELIADFRQSSRQPFPNWK